MEKWTCKKQKTETEKTTSHEGVKRGLGVRKRQVMRRETKSSKIMTLHHTNRMMGGGRGSQIKRGN